MGAGDDKEKQRLYEEYSGLLTGIVRKILRGGGCPESHVAEVHGAVWARIIGKLSQVNNPASHGPWVVTIAKNEAFRHLQDCRGEQLTPLDEAQELPVALIVSIQEEIESAELIDKVFSWAETVSPEYRLILILYLNDFRFDEVGELLGKTTAAVRSTYYHHRHKLQKLLREDLGLGRGDDRP